MVAEGSGADVAGQRAADAHRHHRGRGAGRASCSAACSAPCIGYLLGMSPTAEFALSPYILALQIAPKVAFAPLFILWMGFTVYPKILVAILIVFFPVMVNVLTAVRTVDPDLINLARAFKATPRADFLEDRVSGVDAAAVRGACASARRWRWSAWWSANWSAATWGSAICSSFGEGQANTAMVFVAIIMLTLVGGIAYLAGDPARAARAALPAQARAHRLLGSPAFGQRLHLLKALLHVGAEHLLHVHDQAHRLADEVHRPVGRPDHLACRRPAAGR